MFRRLPRNVYLLGLLSFFNDISSDMITPLLPAFLASMGLGAEFLGLMEGVANSLSNLTKLFSGWYADKLGKNKTLTVLGYALAACVRPFLAIPIPGIILATRFLDRIGKGIRTAPRDTLLTASLEQKSWGRAFGVQRAMDHAGALLGPPIATLLLTVFAIKLPHLFLIASVPALLAIFFIPRFVQDFKKEKVESPPKLSWRKLSKPLKIYILIIFLAALSTPSELFLILRMKDLGLPLAQTPFAWFLLTLCALLAAFFGGIIADHWSRRKTMGLGWALFAFVYVGFAYNQRLSLAWLLVAFYGIQNGLVEASERTFAAKIAGEANRGTTLGWYYFAYGLGLLPASLLFGFLWKAWSPSHTFMLYALLSLLPVLLLFFLPSDRQIKTPASK